MEDIWPRGVQLRLLAQVFPLGQPPPAAAPEQEDQGDEAADQDHDDDGQEPGLAVSAKNLRLLKYDTRYVTSFVVRAEH